MRSHACNHVFFTEIATDWTKHETVPTPNCMSCGCTNPTYDSKDEDNVFHREHWDLEFKDDES